MTASKKEIGALRLGDEFVMRNGSIRKVRGFRYDPWPVSRVYDRKVHTELPPDLEKNFRVCWVECMSENGGRGRNHGECSPISLLNQASYKHDDTELLYTLEPSAGRGWVLKEGQG
jgi:hypothetical protein